jgi:hypothetical protein
MKQQKVISLPTNESKIYKQILAFMNFLLDLTPQERGVLAEIIRLDNEYSMLPKDKRAKFILSTEIRKEIRDNVDLKEKQFNVVLSRLKTKTFFGKLILDDNNYIHPDLSFKPDSDGFKFEVNFVMTTIQPVKPSAIEYIETAPVTDEKVIQELKNLNTPPTEYKHDASKALVIEEEDFNIEILPSNDDYAR